MNLDDWQKKLEGNFSALKELRQLDKDGHPIFALEHGLNGLERSALKTCVREHILRTERPNWTHRLPWTVYATEIGYAYSGEEYWQTFNAKTRGWRSTYKSWIRLCFEDFQVSYNGVQPRGPWAERFSIICWPLTHAILPRDLQRLLAKILFELSLTLVDREEVSPRDLGELVAGKGWNLTSRFIQFCEDPLLVGQVSRALLEHSETDRRSIISADSLTRISHDLYKERQARAWMKSARARTKGRVRYRAVGRSTPGGQGLLSDAVQTRVRLDLGLVVHYSNEEGWIVSVEVPDFSPLLAEAPNLREAFLKSRCRIHGSSGRPKLGRWLLMPGSKKVRLQEWPSPGTPIVSLDEAPQSLEDFLGANCVLRSGPTWLFRIRKDGQGVEVHGTTVRPGGRYLLLRTVELPGDSGQIRTVDVACSGLYAIEIDLSDSVSEGIKHLIAEVLGLNVAETVEIWPAGLIPRHWKGEGVAEWLKGESPRVAIRADHDVDRFVVEFESRELKLAPTGVGEPVFFEMDPMPPGEYQLKVRTETSDPGNSIEPGELLIRISDNYEEGRGEPFWALFDPATPTLEEVWEGRVRFEVHGPQRRLVNWEASLFVRDGDQAIKKEKVPPQKLPVKPEEWQAVFRQHFREVDRVAAKYDVSQECHIRWSTDELEDVVLKARREFTPLRWAVIRTNDAHRLVLHDDTGAEEPAVVNLFEFERPDKAQKQETAVFESERGKLVEPGLYLAESGQHQRAVIIPRSSHRGFEELIVEPHLNELFRVGTDLKKPLQFIELWGGARIPGNLIAEFKRRSIIAAISCEVFSVVGGRRWSRAERHYKEKRSPFLEQAAQEVSSKGRERWLGPKIVDHADELSVLSAEERVQWLMDLSCGAFGLQPGPESRWLFEFGLRLASSPETLLTWAGDQVSIGLENIKEKPAIIRVSRLCVFVVEEEAAADASKHSSSAWDWQ